jgi:hypothetical protein
VALRLAIFIFREDETIATTFVVDRLQSAWRRAARKAVLFAYAKSTLYPMTWRASSDILETGVSGIGDKE